MSPVRILLSASFPRPRVSSVSSVAATSHCRHGFFSDAVQAASSLVRSFPVHVPSTYSRCPLSLFSIFSRSPLSLLTLFLCSNVLPRLTRRALASSPHIVASPSHASVIACLHHFSRSPCTYPQVIFELCRMHSITRKLYRGHVLNAAENGPNTVWL